MKEAPHLSVELLLYPSQLCLKQSTGLFLRHDPAKGLPSLRFGRNTWPTREGRQHEHKALTERLGLFCCPNMILKTDVNSWR